MTFFGTVRSSLGQRGKKTRREVTNWGIRLRKELLSSPSFYVRSHPESQ